MYFRQQKLTLFHMTVEFAAHKVDGADKKIQLVRVLFSPRQSERGAQVCWGILLQGGFKIFYWSRNLFSEEKGNREAYGDQSGKVPQKGYSLLAVCRQAKFFLIDIEMQGAYVDSRIPAFIDQRLG
jgi:hypothetical protein